MLTKIEPEKLTALTFSGGSGRWKVEGGRWKVEGAVEQSSGRAIEQSSYYFLPRSTFHFPRFRFVPPSTIDQCFTVTWWVVTSLLV